MDTKHTPGPWTVFAQPITSKADAILEMIEQVQATETITDHIYLINADGKCPAVTGCGPTSEANARLISAAPDLLDALDGLAAILRDDERSYVREYVRRADAAIAKATGQ